MAYHPPEVRELIAKGYASGLSAFEVQSMVMGELGQAVPFTSVFYHRPDARQASLERRRLAQRRPRYLLTKKGRTVAKLASAAREGQEYESHYMGLLLALVDGPADVIRLRGRIYGDERSDYPSHITANMSRVLAAAARDGMVRRCLPVREVKSQRLDRVAPRE